MLDKARLTHDGLLRSTYETADCVLGIAPYVEEFLGGELKLRRFEVMSDGALHSVRPPVVRSGRQGPVRLLHVGRTVRTKGLRDVIRAMDRLRDLDVVLDVLGEGNDSEACKSLVRELGLEDRITLHGMVSRPVVDGFYERADVFVFPSYREPGGGVILEAMSFGLPMVLVDRGGRPRSRTGPARCSWLRSRPNNSQQTAPRRFGLWSRTPPGCAPEWARLRANGHRRRISGRIGSRT